MVIFIGLYYRLSEKLLLLLANSPLTVMRIFPLLML